MNLNLCKVSFLLHHPHSLYFLTVPTPPRSLMIVDITDTTVTLSWMPPDPPNGIIRSYRVQYRRSDSSSSNYNSFDTNTNDLTYTVTGLSTNTEYNFRVRADTVVGRSDPSNVVTSVGKILLLSYVYIMLNKNTLGVKKVRGQSEATLQTGSRDQKV